MEVLEKVNDFGFTAYVWDGLNFKHWLFRPVEELIVQNFELKNYTYSEKISRIIFAFQINPSPVNRIFDYPNTFAYKRGLLFLYGKIDYQIFLEASDKEALNLMCQSYLDAILTIPSLRGMKKVLFDAQKLHDDLKNLFLEKGFLS